MFFFFTAGRFSWVDAGRARPASTSVVTTLFLCYVSLIIIMHNCLYFFTSAFSLHWSFQHHSWYSIKVPMQNNKKSLLVCFISYFLVSFSLYIIFKIYKFNSTWGRVQCSPICVSLVAPVTQFTPSYSMLLNNNSCCSVHCYLLHPSWLCLNR